jgi:hypothetical protein
MVCQENHECGIRDPSRWQRNTLCPQELALTSLTGGGRSVGIVCSRTEATELFFTIYESSVDQVTNPDLVCSHQRVTMCV